MCDMFAKDNNFIKLYKRLGIEIIGNGNISLTAINEILGKTQLDCDEVKPDFIVEKKDDVR